ncbi:cell wall metabolism sensor histidine kinase WalK [Lapidilactobacillus mulanensis]|uniref:cell wall metabolism sensor histidine kinase WalK n=1 Tax=Lapidilactobacillus mulanensis TaxID=2485999 RepID=UPI000F7950B9|nr:cell wall metabolism sensor histidine kinase WalK [Lapidilactobacillus mulanensis]
MNGKIKPFQSIHFKIAIVFVLLLLVTIEIIGAYFVKQLEQQNITNFENLVTIQPYISTQLSTELSDEDTETANRNVKNIVADIDNSSISEVLVVDNKGVVRGTSNANDQASIGQRTPKSDIKNVIYANRKKTEITSTSDGSFYTSITPLTNQSTDANQVVGAIYVRASMDSVYRNINQVTVIFLTASLVAGLLGMIIAIFIARAITQPIDEMKKQAIRIADGDYSGQVRIYGHDELGQLAFAVNNLSIRVEEAQEVSDAERRRLDSVLSHMTDGVIATDRRGNVTIVNEAAQTFLDATSDETIGESILTVLGIEKEYSLRDLLENKHDMVIEPDAQNEDDDPVSSEHARHLILHVDFSLIQRETGFISGIVCVLHDVTEQEKNERERREFVSNVSHELRTPLTSVRSYIEALTDGAWKDEKLAPQFLNVTQEETDRMIRMINELLSLSRLDQGTAKMELEYVNFNEFFSYILNRFDMMIKTEQSDPKKKKYRIKREFTKRDLWVEIDTDKMMQVIDNIMNNAIKYSPDGGVITTRLMESHNNLVVSISDQGLGIPRKDISKVFDRFYRVDKARSRKQGGTGLGLAISKEVVAAHHGRIWVDSAEGRGSTFYISLPYQPYEDGGEWNEEN